MMEPRSGVKIIQTWLRRTFISLALWETAVPKNTEENKVPCFCRLVTVFIRRWPGRRESLHWSSTVNTQQGFLFLQKNAQTHPGVTVNTHAPWWNRQRTTESASGLNTAVTYNKQGRTSHRIVCFMITCESTWVKHGIWAALRTFYTFREGLRIQYIWNVTCRFLFQ